MFKGKAGPRGTVGGHVPPSRVLASRRAEGVLVAPPSPLPVPDLRSQAAFDLETGPLCCRDPNQGEGRPSLPHPWGKVCASH